MSNDPESVEETTDDVMLEIRLPAQLLSKIEAVQRSHRMPSVEAVILKAIENVVQVRGDDDHSIQLTGRQREILCLIGQGLTAREIGKKLRIRLKTVEYHRNRLMKVVGARRLADLVRCSIRLGLIHA